MGPELAKCAFKKFPEVVGLFCFGLVFGVFEASRDQQSKCHKASSFESENFNPKPCPLEGS